MGDKRKPERAAPMAISTKHQILRKTEAYLKTPGRRSFAKMVDLYKKPSYKAVLRHCVKNNIMTQDQMDLIVANYGPLVPGILKDLRSAFKNMDRTRATLDLDCVVGGRARKPVEYSRTDKVIKATFYVRATPPKGRKKGSKDGITSKLMAESADPGYAKGLVKLHDRLGAILEDAAKQQKKQAKKKSAKKKAKKK